MTSKECLKRLYNNLGCDDCTNDKCKFNREILRECDEWYEVIKQDLERLEELEKENKELKERYKHRAETSNDLCKAVKQYENAIEILKEVCSLNCDKTLETEKNFFRLDQEEYELLKEVLGNEQEY